MAFRRYIIKEFFVTNVLRRFARRNAPWAPRMVAVSNDYIGHWIAIAGGYELQLLNPTMEFLQQQGFMRGGTCIDVGANIGNHAVFFRRFFDRVVAIEANPDVFAILKLNSTPRGIDCRNIGVGRTKGRASLYLGDAGNEGTGSVKIEATGDQTGHEIEIEPLDTIAADITGHIDLIKIDVEGMEQDVLLGAANIIANNKPAIIFEYHRHLQGDADTFDILTDGFGYRNFYYAAPRFDFKKFDSIFSDVAQVVVNFVANSRFTVRKINAPKLRSYDFVIAIPG